MPAAARLTDIGSAHACFPDSAITQGSPDVFINGLAAARIGDAVSCGGNISTGSGNVIIGDTPWRSPTHDCGVQSLKNPLLILSPPLEVLKDPVSWSR